MKKLKVHTMRNTLFYLMSLLLLSCSKEEFSAVKTPQISAVSPLATTSTKLCSQKTLISPKVDILMLWDNSSSSIFINQATKNSFNQLVTSVSANFDYHILSVPLISTSPTNVLNEASLATKKYDDSAADVTLSGSALSILKTKDQVASALNFTRPSGSYEPGVDRVLSVLQANRANGIFRNDAYTIVVLMSNGDDTSCEIETGFTSCSNSEAYSRMQNKINSLLCLRGNANGLNCSGFSSINSTMMRFINIAPLTSCANGLGKINSRYRMVAKKIYEAPYSNSWPTANDDLNPFVSNGISYPDNYDICSIDFNHIFDGVNTAIKQTLIKHVYDYWPVAASGASVDPDTIKVVRDDGKVLTNRTGESNPSDGFAYVGVQTNRDARVLPTRGEPYTGKMIQLFGSNDSDLIVYPRCLTVTFDEIKTQYGFIFLKNGEPQVSTLEVHINGAVVPQSSTDGWDYMGLQYTQTLTSAYPDLKIQDLPAGGVTSGYFIRLNGSYKFKNTAGTPVAVRVDYIPKGQ